MPPRDSLVKRAGNESVMTLIGLIKGKPQLHRVSARKAEALTGADRALFNEVAAAMRSRFPLHPPLSDHTIWVCWANIRAAYMARRYNKWQKSVEFLTHRRQEEETWRRERCGTAPRMFDPAPSSPRAVYGTSTFPPQMVNQNTGEIKCDSDNGQGFDESFFAPPAVQPAPAVRQHSDVEEIAAERYFWNKLLGIFKKLQLVRGGTSRIERLEDMTRKIIAEERDADERETRANTGFSISM
ncbi:hypothetical protein QR680_016928 [Steinernema hermaphroditum]|uniref:Uncharacterized protein n=1 Tax=Steinernema hermaphroditum TaxID=289476 RepID=A0AA39HD76_9BILA|nr:hypothetical protein QR680_016928 [Steinernema hermaphroditum]